MVSSPTLPPRENVRRYLRVLSAFKYLHNAMPTQLLKPHEALYEQSTYRLQLWLEKIVQPGGTVVGPQETIYGPWGTPVRPGERIGPLVPKELPPLDVAMALHSYMLCPQRYFEDAMLRFRELELRIGDYPFAMIVDALKPDNQGYDPDRIVDASRHWEKETGCPFDPVQFLLCDVARSVKCPYDGCGIVTGLNSASFNGGKFQYVCCCRKSVTDEALRVKKFLSALAQAHRAPSRFCLPNTANLVEGVINFRAGLAPLIYDVFKRPDGKLPSVDDIMQAQPGTSSGSGMVRIRSAIVSKVDHTRFRISSVPILLHAFEHPYPFTQDIVAAIIVTAS
ncbi:hypothetical protein EYR40_010568 [Pleurotus pulmonarius]|nr:hypothetical protein EYR40_010568 [Pleurotus pulmonarius]